VWELDEDHAVVKSWYHEVYKSLYDVCNDFRSWLDFVGVRWTIYSMTWWTFTNYELPFDYSDSLVLYGSLISSKRDVSLLLLTLFDSFQNTMCSFPFPLISQAKSPQTQTTHYKTTNTLSGINLYCLIIQTRPN
jgi:hypothetical protein